MDFLNYVALTLFLLFAALFVTGIYNRYFHTLSKYPGPFWGSVTDFYKFYMITSVPTLGLELHKKHGSRYLASTSKQCAYYLLQGQSSVWHQICYPSVIQTSFPKSITGKPTKPPGIALGLLGM